MIENVKLAKYKLLLQKLGEASLQELIGEDTIRSLRSMGYSDFDRESLSDVLETVQGERCILDDQHIRQKVLNTLSRPDAEDLIDFLGLGEFDNPWEKLNKTLFIKNSKNYISLSAWLEIPEINELDNVYSPVEKKSKIEPEYKLFNHQIQAVKDIKHSLKSSNRVILHMPTGSGKTRTAMNIVCDHFRSCELGSDIVVWLAHTEELCQQAAEEFEKAWKFLGNKDVNLIRHYSPFTSQEIKLEGPTILILSLASAHSMLKNDRQAEIFAINKLLGLTIIDEAHKAIAETYKLVLDTFANEGSNKKLLGLTATPGRSYLDIDEDEKLANFFNRKKVSMSIEGYDSPIDYLRSENYLAIQENIPIAYLGGKKIEEHELKNGDYTKKQLQDFADDADRNQRIFERAKFEIENGGQVILFACSKKNAILLTSLLVLNDIKAACVLGNTTNRSNIIQDFKNNKLQILVNYGVLTTGFDAPKADVAIIARPTQSIVLYSQMVGRVIRGEKAGGTKTCRIITVVDQVNGFRDLSESFDYWDELWE